MSTFVRRARLEDFERIYEIWLAGIENSLGGRPPDGINYEAYYRERVLRSDDIFPFFVVENKGEVVSWASATPYRANPAVRRSMAEISAYTDPSHQGGLATKMVLSALFKHADQCPHMHLLVAFTADTNTAAERLCKYFSMQKVYSIKPSSKHPDFRMKNMFIYVCAATSDHPVPP